MGTKSEPQLFIVAIDGPSASGKSTLGQSLASHFDYGYVDSGAVYRAVGYLAGQLGIKPSEPAKLTSAIRTAMLDIDSTPEACYIILNGVRLKGELRDPSITVITATLAALPAVRAELTEILRGVSHPRGLVMDGRDIGTNVFPNATVKLFLEADPVIRAHRRWKDEVRQGRVALQKEIEASIEERDRLDRARTANPLLKAPDAVTLDTSLLTADQVKQVAISIVEQVRHARLVWST